MAANGWGHSRRAKGRVVKGAGRAGGGRFGGRAVRESRAGGLQAGRVAENRKATIGANSRITLLVRCQTNSRITLLVRRPNTLLPLRNDAGQKTKSNDRRSVHGIQGMRGLEKHDSKYSSSTHRGLGRQETMCLGFTEASNNPKNGRLLLFF